MAPQEYLRRLVETFEERMLMYKKQIEIMESHMASLSQGQTLTPQGDYSELKQRRFWGDARQPEVRTFPL